MAVVAGAFASACAEAYACACACSSASRARVRASDWRSSECQGRNCRTRDRGALDCGFKRGC